MYNYQSLCSQSKSLSDFSNGLEVRPLRKCSWRFFWEKGNLFMNVSRGGLYSSWFTCPDYRNVLFLFICSNKRNIKWMQGPPTAHKLYFISYIASLLENKAIQPSVQQTVQLSQFRVCWSAKFFYEVFTAWNSRPSRLKGPSRTGSWLFPLGCIPSNLRLK